MCSPSSEQLQEEGEGVGEEMRSGADKTERKKKRASCAWPHTRSTGIHKDSRVYEGARGEVVSTDVVLEGGSMALVVLLIVGEKSLQETLPLKSGKCGD